MPCRSHHARQLNTLKDTFTSDLTERENIFIDLHNENDNIERKLEVEI